jgi:phosphoribosylanthranilate isomerase
MIGLVFAESRRQLTIEAACNIVQALRSTGSATLVVGVFVNETQGRLREIVDATGIDVLQLSGDESPDVVGEAAQLAPVIKALRFPAGTGPQEALSVVRAYTAPRLGERLRLLVDAYHPGLYGGTGSHSDWALASTLAEREDLILAGGLTPANVARAMREVAPWGVDVSSGVEREGRKDRHLIEEFINAALQRGNPSELER